jgi:hypothetical protein
MGRELLLDYLRQQYAGDKRGESKVLRARGSGDYQQVSILELYTTIVRRQ